MDSIEKTKSIQLQTKQHETANTITTDTMTIFSEQPAEITGLIEAIIEFGDENTIPMTMIGEQMKKIHITDNDSKENCECGNLEQIV